MKVTVQTCYCYYTQFGDKSLLRSRGSDWAIIIAAVFIFAFIIIDTAVNNEVAREAAKCNCGKGWIFLRHSYSENPFVSVRPPPTLMLVQTPPRCSKTHWLIFIFVGSNPLRGCINDSDFFFFLRIIAIIRIKAASSMTSFPYTVTSLWNDGRHSQLHFPRLILIWKPSYLAPVYSACITWSTSERATGCALCILRK